LPADSQSAIVKIVKKFNPNRPEASGRLSLLGLTLSTVIGVNALAGCGGEGDPINLYKQTTVTSLAPKMNKDDCPVGHVELNPVKISQEDQQGPDSILYVRDVGSSVSIKMAVADTAMKNYLREDEIRLLGTILRDENNNCIAVVNHMYKAA
jgi:hypothetical protein